ncbi:unnamed protein product [Caenorhabditis brenneri]
MTSSNNKACLIKMPEEIMRHIVGFLGFLDILNLRKTCHALRDFIINTKPPSTFSEIYATIELDQITFNLNPFPEKITRDDSKSPFRISYEKPKNSKNDCIITWKLIYYHPKKSKKLKNCDILDAFSTDFGVILAHQKSILRNLNLIFHYPNDKEKRDVFKVVDCFKGLTTNYKEYSLKVEELHLECKGEHEVLEVLPNLDPDYVKTLKIDVGCKKANLKLQEIIYLEQWTRAKEVELIGCFGDYCHFEHFEKVGVSIQIITTEDIMTMKEMLFQNPQMRNVSFKFQHYYTDQDLTQRFGNTPREFNEWGREMPWKTWFLRDPDGGCVVKMEYRVDLINLVKMDKDQVPTDANIVD